MVFRSRLARLTAVAALALPAIAAISVLPATTAQAAECGAQQAAVHFVNGSVHCQDYGSVTYIALRESDKVKNVCAGSSTMALVFPETAVTRPVFPGKCEKVSLDFNEIVVRTLAF
jgi:hypothetical protein